MKTTVRILLLALTLSCGGNQKYVSGEVHHGLNHRIANLQRAAALPWADGGQCVVQEASNDWPVLIERCFHALDSHRIRFRDPKRSCAVASADAATLETLVGICILSQPEIVVGAVIIVGAVVVAAAIAEELDEYRRTHHGQPEEGQAPESVRPRPSQQDEPSVSPSPSPDGSASIRDPLPPLPTQSDPRRPECEPIRVPPRGGHNFHNWCADQVPHNDFRGFNALVNGKRFDALQLATRTLWEVKTTAIETYNPFIHDRELDQQVEEGRRERDLATACGYQFVIGVRTQAHKDILKDAAPDLTVVLMPWC